MFVSNINTESNRENLISLSNNKENNKSELVAAEVLNSQNMTSSQLEKEFVVIDKEKIAASTENESEIEEFVLIDGQDAQEYSYPESRIISTAKKVVELVETVDQYGGLIEQVVPQSKPFFIATKTILSTKQILRTVSLPENNTTLPEKLEKHCSNSNKVLRCAQGVIESVELISPNTTSKIQNAKKCLDSVLYYTSKAEIGLSMYNRGKTKENA